MSLFLNIKTSITIQNVRMTQPNFGIVTMMKASINMQRTILSCPEGIYDKDCFIDNILLNFRSMGKEERDLTLMMELKRILWEVNAPSLF